MDQELLWKKPQHCRFRVLLFRAFASAPSSLFGCWDKRLNAWWSEAFNFVWILMDWFCISNKKSKRPSQSAPVNMDYCDSQFDHISNNTSSLAKQGLTVDGWNFAASWYVLTSGGLSHKTNSLVLYHHQIQGPCKNLIFKTNTCSQSLLGVL